MAEEKRKRDRQATFQSTPGKKDRKKWCHGKAGIEHKPVCRSYIEVKHPGWKAPETWRILVCSECGKELERYCPCSWDNRPQKAPGWVDC